MHAGQVIALKIIVNVGLPVAFHLVNAALVKLHFLKGEMRHLLRQLSEKVEERRGLGIEVYEDKTGKLFHAQRSQAEILAAEIFYFLAFGSIQQFAVE